MGYPWWLGVAVSIAIVMVAGPWALLLVSKVRARDVVLIAHYQSLILALIALAVAVMGLISYLSVEQRVQDQMASYYQIIKAENKTRLRELLSLEQILNHDDTEDFEEFVTKAIKDVEMWEFFQKDIEDGFMDMMWSSRSNVRTSVIILRFLQRHPECGIEDRWRFYLSAMSEEPAFLPDALTLVSQLSREQDGGWFISHTLRLVELWGDFSEEQRRLIGELIRALRKQLIDTSRDISEPLEKHFSSFLNAHSEWPERFEGHLDMMICDSRTGEPSFREWQYFDVLSDEGWASKTLIDGQSVREILATDIQNWMGEQLFQRLRDPSIGAKVGVIVDPADYEVPCLPKALLYGCVVLEKGREPAPYHRHSYKDFFRQLERDNDVSVLCIRGPNLYEHPIPDLPEPSRRRPRRANPYEVGY